MTDDAPETPAADLLAITFDDGLMAQEFLLAMVRLGSRQRLTLEDAAIVTRTPKGKVRVLQTRDLSTSDGVLSGGWMGLLAGLFIGGPLIGGALGAALGGLWSRLRDIGIDDQQMKDLGESLEPDQAAVFLLLSSYHPTHMAAELRRFPGRVLYTTLGDDERRHIADALAEGYTGSVWG